MLDLRVEKEFTFSDIGLTLGVDVFNVFNEATIQQRQGRLHAAGAPGGSSTTGDHVLEVVSPRIFRLGARISLR